MQNSEMAESEKATDVSCGNQATSPFCHSPSSDEDAVSAETAASSTPSSEKRSTSAGDSSSIRHRKSDVSESKDSGSKICRICGDKALGYNFNVISCESCKAFFRRNALKKKQEFICPFSNNCDVTFVSRRFCQRCRMKKCFEVGMNPDWILSQEALAAKRCRRSETNRASVEMERRTPLELKKISAICPRTSSVDPVLIAASSADGLSMLPNLTSASQRQQQLALLTQQSDGVSKVITILPVQSTQAKLDSTLYCLGSSNVLLTAGSCSGQSNSASQSSALNIHNEPAETKCGDDTINIPKTVLINLITKCHSSSDNCSTGQETNTKTVLASFGFPSHSALPKQCSCKCTCGAKSNTDAIGVEKRDKMISTEDLFQPVHPTRGDPRTAFAFNSAHSTTAAPHIPVSSLTSSPLDFSAFGHTKQHSQMPQQSMYGDVLDAAIASVFHDTNGCALFNGDVHPVQTVHSSVAYNPGQRRQLGAIERQRLDELLAANELMKEPLEGIIEQRIYQGHQVDAKLLDVINMTDIAVRRIIKMNKRIEAFRNLCQEDQIALLKGGCTELMILRGIMTYDPEKDSWLTRVQNSGHEYIKLEVLKGVRGNIYEEHKKYVQSFPAGWRTSEPIMLILGAITLFNPDRPNIVRRDLIRAEEQFYYDLLKKYICTIYDSPDAELVYGGLVARVGTLHRVNEYAASIFLDINPRDVEPLLIEIFDLKK